MRNIRSLQEIVSTIKSDEERRTELLAAAIAGDTSKYEELSILEAEHASFRKMCIGFAPADPIAAGFQWGEEVFNKAYPALKARVRENASLEIDGEIYDVVAATRIVAEKAKTTARVADWEGKSGRLGVLAGFEYQLAGENDLPAAPITKSEETSAVNKEIPLGSNYDLFA